MGSFIIVYYYEISNVKVTTISYTLRCIVATKDRRMFFVSRVVSESVARIGERADVETL